MIQTIPCSHRNGKPQCTKIHVLSPQGFFKLWKKWKNNLIPLSSTLCPLKPPNSWFEPFIVFETHYFLWERYLGSWSPLNCTKNWDRSLLPLPLPLPLPTPISYFLNFYIFIHLVKKNMVKWIAHESDMKIVLANKQIFLTLSKFYICRTNYISRVKDKRPQTKIIQWLFSATTLYYVCAMLAHA